MAGCLGGFNNILKVKALQFIDTTIYYPLFKLVSPILAIIFGIVFFQELFTATEWAGLLLGIFVPLLLINTGERGRQKNLVAGLMMVLVTAMIAASASVFGKYAAAYALNVISALLVMSVGILLGSIIANYYKNGVGEVKKLFSWHIDKAYTSLAVTRGVIMTVAAGLILVAYSLGGELAIVHTINSLYILIPIVLSIIFYNEHWNLQKAIAIILSVASLALLG
jgi:drug/metabolite transporter (DMT)-like permease